MLNHEELKSFVAVTILGESDRQPLSVESVPLLSLSAPCFSWPWPLHSWLPVKHRIVDMVGTHLL